VSLFDKALKSGKQAASKAKGFASDHTDQVKGAIDKAEGLADKATKGKYKDKIEKAGSKADAAVDKLKKDEGPTA
jgi:uncharacterized protein YjbJ (UPF0337 family)